MIKQWFINVYHQFPIIREIKRIENDIHDDRELLVGQLYKYKQDILKEEKYTRPRKLNRYETQVFSQSGEDGIIREIFKRIGISAYSFLEIGTGNGLENNTTFLLLQGWNGFWIEGNKSLVRDIRKKFKDPISKKKLKVLCSFVTAENVNNLIRGMEISGEIDLFSLDLDRNTFWIWKALKDFRPRVIVVEYNPVFPSDVDWKVDYDAFRSWNGTAYFGASLKAYELLAKEYGYCLVGCTLNGVNAFFIRKDLCEDKFEEPFSAENHYEPHRFFLTRRVSRHSACFNDLPPKLIDEK